MTKEKALEKLHILLEDLDKLPKYIDYNKDSMLTKFKLKTNRYLKEIFTDRTNSFAFEDIEFKPIVPFHDEQNNLIKIYEKAIENTKALFEAFIEEVEEWKNTPADNCLIKLNYFIRSAHILTLEDDFKRFNVNEKFDKFKLELEMFLKNTFGETSDEFTKFKKIRFLYVGPRGMEGLSVPLDISTYKDGLKSTKILLEFIKENILKNSLSKIQPDLQTIIENRKTTSNKVFIVHGHDNGAKQEVARFLEKLGLDPIILHEQASGQRTIIEKIEEYTGQVGFGVVLYTECDVGGKDKDSLQSRARQNVVFEHGYLIGLLGRNRVCPLVKGKVETPGDISGVVYTQMDDNGSWHLPLFRELIAAGYDIDSNKLI